MEQLTIPQEPAAAPTGPPDVIPQDEPRATLDHKTVCVGVRLCKPGNRRKVSSAAVTIDADKKLIAVTKLLLDCPEYKAIQQVDSEIRTYLARMCLPSLFREGIYRVAIQTVTLVDAQLRVYAEQRARAVEVLENAYPARIEEARIRLRSVFRETDYGSATELGRQCSMDWQYISFSVPGQLRSISQQLYADQAEQIQARLREAETEITALLRQEMADLVTHLVDRLSPSPDGKRKIFRDSLTENLSQWLDTFTWRGITDDAGLKNLVEQARQLTRGITPDALRNSDQARSRVAAGFADIKTALDRMLTDAPSRRITFDERE